MEEIVFFETNEVDKNYIKKNLKGYKLKFFTEKIQDVDISKYKNANTLSVFIYSKVTSKILSNLKNVKLIATRSTGFDHINLDYCNEKNIKVANVPYYGENTVAEHTFALILNLSRKVHISYLREKQKNYSLEGLQGFDLKGKTMGIIGAGRIGLHTSRIANGFGMNVKVFDIHRDTFLSELLHFDYTSVDEILKTSDIISLHMPYNQHTHHFIDKAKLKKMKKGALIINTSRGGLIDTDALFEALLSKKLGGAGLDVIEGEELIAHEDEILLKNKSKTKTQQIFRNHKIFELDNVIFTPHNAFNSTEAIQRIINTTIKNISNIKKNPKEVHLVNK